MRQEIEHENAFIRLVVTTTVGESGIDPSTDGSCEPSDQVCLVQQSRQTPDGAVTDYEVWALGATLQDPAPRWIRCPDIDRTRAQAAVELLVEQAWDLRCDAEAALQDEGAAADDGQWLSRQERNRRRIDEQYLS